MNKGLFLFFSLFFGLNANAISWISCGCSDKAGNFQRSCYSTTSCQTCCCYQKEDGSKCNELPSNDDVKFSKIDHESKNISLIEEGER